MIATITKRFTFDAAHRLDRLPAEHKCHRMHGHTYEVVFEFTGPVDAYGFVMDYAEIDKMWEPLYALVDHRVLNGVPGLELPTTEIVAAWLYVAMSETMAPLALLGVFLSHVTLRESTSTSCTIGIGCLDDEERWDIKQSVARALGTPTENVQ